MTTETEQILSQLPLSQLAARLGTDEATAREAAEAALPTLLAGLTNEAGDPRRSGALASAVTRDHDPATLEADDPLSRVDPAEGDRIVSHLFGGDRAQVESQVQQALGGTSGSLVRKVLPLLAPLVMSWLAGKMGGGRRSGGGLGDILGDVLGGAASGRTGGGGLGDILNDVLGGAASGGSGGGLADILGQLGGKAGGGGGLDDLLGSILGPGSPAPRASARNERGTGVTDVGDVFGDRR